MGPNLRMSKMGGGYGGYNFGQKLTTGTVKISEEVTMGAMVHHVYWLSVYTLCISLLEFRISQST
jgi:hypothetical protein